MKPKTAQGDSVFEPLRALREHEYTEVVVSVISVFFSVFSDTGLSRH
jgi:hypothetical protein